MKKYDIVSFGEILIDFTMIDHSSRLFEQNPGGAPANLLVCASRLGSSTAFIGKAGLDMHGSFLKDVLDKENVDTKGFILDRNFFTTLAFVKIDENKERSFSFARKPGADTQMNINDVDLSIIKNCRIFHVGSLSLTTSPSKETTYECIKVAKENGAIISYDPNYRASLWDNEDVAIKNMRSIVPDIIKISEEEIYLLTNVNDVNDASNILFKSGIKIVVITLGEKGCIITNKDGTILVEGYKCKLVDTTGAGDAFFGAFLSKIAKEESIDNISLETLKEYAKFSNAAASLCVEKRGAIPSLPSLNCVLQKIKSE